MSLLDVVIAYKLRDRLESIEMQTAGWIQLSRPLWLAPSPIGDYILNLSKFPLLRSLTLSLRYPIDSLEAAVNLFAHRNPCPPLHTVTLIFDDVFGSQPGNFRVNTRQVEVKLSPYRDGVACRYGTPKAENVSASLSHVTRLVFVPLPTHPMAAE